MVRFVLGRAGQGKTRMVYKEIKQALLDTKRQVLLLIVPEQHTLQAEKELVAHLEAAGILDVEVTSFSRLVQKVLNETGGRRRVVLNDLGRSLLISKAVSNCQGNLRYYAKSASQAGFVQRAALTIREFKQQGWTAADLRQALEAAPASSGSPAVLEQKLGDVLQVFEAMEAELQQFCLDHDDLVNLFVQQAAASSYLASSRIWIDGFEGFSIQNMRIIGTLARVCPDLAITLNIDPTFRAFDRELFRLSQYCLEYMEMLLNEAGIANCRQALPHAPGRPGREALEHLERELFAFPGNIFTGLPAGLELFSAAQPAMEVECAAARILELVMEGGLRFRDCAVICGDFQLYAPLIQRYFGEYEIPAFMDYKRPLSDHPLPVLFTTALNALIRGFQYEDMALYMKSGLCGLSDDEAEDLENYILAHGIKGWRWRQDFEYGAPEELARANSLRERLMHGLNRLEEGIRAGGNTYAGNCKAIYSFAESLDVPARLARQTEEMAQSGRLESMYLIQQGWNNVIELLDQAAGVMGDRTCTLPEFAAMLRDGLESIKLGLIPTTIDQVQVGDISRTLPRDIRALIILGVNDGIVPSLHHQGLLLNDDEMEALAAIGMISYDRQRPVSQERLQLHNILARPREILGLYYSRSGMNGRAERPSLIIERIRKLYPDIQERDDILDHEACTSRLLKRPRPILRHLGCSLRAEADGLPVGPVWNDLYQYWETGNEQLNWPEIDHHMNMIRQGLAGKPGSEALPAGQTQALYGISYNSSVSRLELQAACPFAYFAEYGLKPRPRQVFSLEKSDAGSLLHACLAAWTNQIRVSGNGWQDMDEAMAAEIFDGVAAEMMSMTFPEMMAHDRWQGLISRRWQRLGRRAAAALCWQIKQGDFIPFGEEMAFREGGDLPPLMVAMPAGGSVKLQGSIDRVDLRAEPDSEGRRWVRIIDYKTGGPKIDYGRLYAGLDLQLSTYLLAVQEGWPEMEPVGIFYLKISDALGRETAPRPVAGKQQKAETRMRGLLRADPDVVKAMDREAQSWSTVVNARLKQKGTALAAGDNYLERHEFRALTEFTRHKLGCLGEEAYRSLVTAEPCKGPNYTACDYCPYPAFCRFETAAAPAAFRRVPELKKAEFFEILSQELRPVNDNQPD